MASGKRGKRRLLGKVVGFALKALAVAFMFLTPALGVWLASSLAAYLNGPIWAVCLAGLASFPGLPLAWDGWAQYRGRKKRARREARGKPVRDPILTWLDRLVLRTVVLNLLFIGALLACYPQAGFTALSTRGDWMLVGDERPWAQTTRRVLFGMAGGLEWLYEATREDPFREFADPNDDLPTPEPNEFADEVATATGKPADVATSRSAEPPPSASVSASASGTVSEPGPAPSEPEPSATTALAERLWPWPATIHPLVRDLPAEAERSIDSVARYIAEREQRPFQRIKALHDYLADRVAYDAPALAAGSIPPQEPARVFRERIAVCAGYARLLVALGEAAGERIVYVGGVSRDQGGDVSGGGHAWNAAEIEGRWYLIDATWDAGWVDGDTFHKQYKSDYLFTPPTVFGTNHFPDREQWQLRTEPLSRGEFMRQPMLKPAFFAHGLRLIEPRRSQITVRDDVSVRVANPRNRFLLANLVTKGAERGADGPSCRVGDGAEIRIDCPIAAPGSYQVWMYANEERTGRYAFVGQVEVNRR